MHDSISGTPLESARKNPTSAPVSTERILSKYERLAKGMEGQFQDIRKNRDENTGFFNVLADGVVGLSGGETGRDIYKSSWDNTAASCKSLLARMEYEIQGRVLTPSEQVQINQVRKQLSLLIGKPWEEVGVVSSVVATAKALPETAVNNTRYAAHGAYGMGKGFIHGAVDIFEVSKLLVGVAVDAQKRAAFTKQCEIIGKCMEQEGFWGIAAEQVGKLIAQEWEKIQKLPPEQQSEAIGKIAGNVIFALTAIKWGIALGKHAANFSSKTTRAAALLEKVAEGSVRGEKLAAISQTTRTLSMGAGILGGILGGPAESLIGVGLVKILAPTFELLRSATAPITQKLAALKSSFAALKEAEKNATPDMQKQLDKVNAALTAEEAKLKVTPIRAELPGPKYRIDTVGSVKIIRLDSATPSANIRNDVLKLLKKHPEVNEIRFGLDFPSSTKRALMDMMSENRPLLGVLRIVPEWRVGTFVIRGVKPVNDILSQQTADRILAGIRDHVTKELDDRFGIGKAARITTSHNKITVGLPKEITTPLPPQHEIDAIVQRAIAEQRHVIEESAARLGKTPAEIKKTLADLRVSGGEARVPAGADDFAKLEAVYESEILARGGTVGPERIAKMREIQKLKADIIQDFRNVKFSHGKNQYPAVILDISGNPRLHPLIGDTVRKPGGIDYLKPAELGKRVENYLNVLNQELDYVAPALNFEHAFREAKEIDRAFRVQPIVHEGTVTHEGRISRQALERTYKGSLSKSAFFEAIEGKVGVCVMIDARGMFSKNSAALDRVSRNIAESGSDVAPVERIDAVGNITRSFVRGTRGIDRAHPDIFSTHGGDEYMYFIEGASQSDIPNITQQARTSIGNQGFDIRASARHTVASREVFDALDGETKVAKAIESISRTRTGESPTFLRHLEVSVESFSPDYIVNELSRRRTAVERAMRHLSTWRIRQTTIELQWLRLQVERTGSDSVRITALPPLQNAA